MTRTIWRIVLPYAVCGVSFVDGVCVSAAPIAKWMIGKTSGECRRFILSKGGIYDVLDQPEIHDIIDGEEK